VLRGPDPNTYLRSDVMPQAVPTTWETIYDPNHPDADWSGLVKSNKYGKKHYQEQSAQKTGILQSESGKSANNLITFHIDFSHYIIFLGIVSKVERHEWAHKRRDIAPVPVATNNLNNRRISYEETKNNIIGGIDVENESERWKTNYQRLAGQEGTGRDQLILQKRQLPKKILSGNNSVPNSARGPVSARGVYEQPSSIYSTSTTKETYGPIEGSLVGYKAPREATRSLLSTISSQINIDDFN